MLKSNHLTHRLQLADAESHNDIDHRDISLEWKCERELDRE